MVNYIIFADEWRHRMVRYTEDVGRDNTVEIAGWMYRHGVIPPTRSFTSRGG
jgi:hypothetical protein